MRSTNLQRIPRNVTELQFVSLQNPVRCKIATRLLGDRYPLQIIAKAKSKKRQPRYNSWRIPANTITLKVDEATLATRKAAWVCPPPKITTGYLARYAKLVTSADRGAILE